MTAAVLALGAPKVGAPRRDGGIEIGSTSNESMEGEAGC